VKQRVVQGPEGIPPPPGRRHIFHGYGSEFWWKDCQRSALFSASCH
jgi:hypothetical protein